MRQRLASCALAGLLACSGGTSAGQPDGQGGDKPDGGSSTTGGLDGGPSGPGDSGAPDAGTLPHVPSYTANKFVTVNATGSGDGSLANPWTLAQAMAQATAGDRVQVGPGVYMGTNQNSRYIPAFYPAHDGTPAQPIVFFAEHRAVYGAANRSEIRSGGTTEDAGCPAFGTYNNSYVIWDGFYVDEASSPSASDTGPVVVWSSDHCSIESSVIRNVAIPRQDNHNAIRVEDASDIALRNNRLTGTRHSGGASQNFAAIMAYDARKILIEHNEIDDVDAAMFPKGDHGPGLGEFTIRYNKVTNARHAAIEVGGIITGAGYGASEFSQNLFIGTKYGVMLISYDASSPRNITVRSNTMIDVEAAILVRSPQFSGGQTRVYEQTSIRDNVIVGSTVGLEYHLDGTNRPVVTSHGFSSNHNRLHDATHVGSLETWFSDGAPSFDTLAEWHAASGFDANSSTGAPLFVGQNDYRLAAGSTALTASSTGGPVGAYVSGSEVIGIIPQ